MKELRVLDYTTGPYLEYTAEYMRQRLADSLKRLEEKRDEFLDLLKAEIPDVDHAIVLMAGVVAGVPLTGKFGVQQDLLTRVADITKKINTLTALSAEYQVLGMNAKDVVVRITLDQAKDWNV